jgi:hypothetical protein
MVGSDQRQRQRSRRAALVTVGIGVALAAVLVGCTTSGSTASGALPGHHTASGAGGSVGPGGSSSAGPAAAPAPGASGPSIGGPVGTPAGASISVPPLSTTGATPRRSALTVTASSAAVREGASITLRFTLRAGDAPVGGATVSVSRAGTTTSAVLDGAGSGSLVVDGLPAGRQTITVGYSGDATHAPSSGSVTVTVAALTRVTLSTSSSTIAPGSPATIDIAVTAGGTPVPGAVVTVSHGGTKVTAPATDATGAATVRLAGLAGGATIVTASYAGDALHTSATGSLGLTVHAASAIAVTASDLQPAAGGRVTIGWTVTAAGRPVAGAPVTVTAGGKALTATSGEDGRGVTDLADLKPGSLRVAVGYAGDAGHGAVNGAVTLAVIGAAQVRVRASDTTVTVHDQVTVTFDVTSATGAVGGPVTVRYAGGSHRVTLGAGGHGAVTIPAGTWPTGMHTVQVDYPGSAGYAPASGSVDVSVSDNPSCPARAKACVDLSRKVSWLQSNGQIVYGPVPISSGRPKYRTPSGSYQVYWKDKNHTSSLFNNAPMPNSLFFNGGIAFHEGDPSVMSHGCIHLTWSASQRYWDFLSVGDAVVVFGYAPY